MTPRQDFDVIEEALRRGEDPAVVQAKLKELEALREKSALLKANPILAYRPNPAQAKMHEAITSSGAVRFEWKSGNRSGKTAFAANEAGAWAMGERLWVAKDSPLRLTPFRPPVVVRIGSTPAELEATVQRYVPAALLQDQVVRTHKNQQGVVSRWELKNGSQILSHSYKQETIEWEGAYAHLWIFNEPPPYDKYIAAVRGLADYNGYAIIVMTHLAEPWIKHRIENKAKSGNKKFFFLQTTSHCNLGFGLSDGGLNALIEDVGGTESLEYRVRVLGESIHSEGLVISEFDSKVHVADVKWDRSWGVYAALDPHNRKPFAGLVAGVNQQGQLCLIREFWRQPPKDHDIVKWIIGEFGRACDGLFVGQRFIDPIAKTPGFWSARNSCLKDELAIKGLAFADGTKDRQNGIVNIKQLFARRVTLAGQPGLHPAVVVDPSCKRVLEELDSWLWDDAEETDIESMMNRARDQYDDQMSNLYRILAARPVHIPRAVYEKSSVFEPHY